MRVRPQYVPIPTPGSAQDVLEQTKMIYHDVRRNAMQAYIQYKV